MIIPFNSDKFNQDWLEYIGHDPVHPTIPKDTRTHGGRTVLAYTDAKDDPECVICAKLSENIVQSMKDILAEDSGNLTAMFYTIFRVPDAIVGAGAKAIREAIAHYKQQGVQNFYTLSPIPSLRKAFSEVPTEQQVRDYLALRQDPVARFHIGNGAVLHAVNFNADNSDIRQEESWGIMVNYRYSI